MEQLTREPAVGIEPTTARLHRTDERANSSPDRELGDTATAVLTIATAVGRARTAIKQPSAALDFALATERRALLFWSKVRVTESGCWEWEGARKYGYGAWRAANRENWRAHRLTWQVAHGPIPDDLQVDHLCRNRACCNPAHLEAVTSAENTARGESLAGVVLRTGHCHRGHAMSGANVLMKDGHRRCRACQRQAEREYRKRVAGRTEAA